MDDHATPGFGDTVTIRSTEDTIAAGYAGLSGIVYGFSTPSVTNIDVVGETADDIALNVHFEEQKSDAWFAPHLVEFVDHNEGSEIRIDGVPKRWIRARDGSWTEEPIPGERRPWWKFWIR